MVRFSVSGLIFDCVKYLGIAFPVAGLGTGTVIGIGIGIGVGPLHEPASGYRREPATT